MNPDKRKNKIKELEEKLVKLENLVWERRKIKGIKAEIKVIRTAINNHYRKLQA